MGMALADLGQYFTHDNEGGPGTHRVAHYSNNLVFLGCGWIAAFP